MATSHVGMLVLAEADVLGLCAVLQVRGTFNTEKMAPESYPGGCQVTVYGKVKPYENLVTALHREILEELGPDTDQLIGVIEDLATRARIVFESRTEEKEIVIWATMLDCSFLRSIRLGPDSGGMRLINPHQVKDIYDLRSYAKETGTQYRNTIAMFEDERKAVEKAFELLS